MKIIIILLFILLATSVYSQVGQEILSFDSNCVEEDVILKIRGDKNIVDTYSFSDCSKWKTDGWEFWKCGCVSQDDVILKIFDISKVISYDVVAQIYVEPLEEVTDKVEGQIKPSPIELRNQNKKRTYTYSNIKLTPPVEEPKPKEPFKFSIPEFDIPSVTILMGTVLIIIVGGIIFAILWIRKQLKDDVKVTKEKPKLPRGIKPLDEDEVNEYLDKYT